MKADFGKRQRSLLRLKSISVKRRNRKKNVLIRNVPSCIPFGCLYYVAYLSLELVSTIDNEREISTVNYRLYIVLIF